MQDLSSEVALKSLGEGDRPITPAALAALLSTLLYSRRGSPFFVEPIVAGLDSRGEPYLCGQVCLLAPPYKHTGLYLFIRSLVGA